MRRSSFVVVSFVAFLVVATLAGAGSAASAVVGSSKPQRQVTVSSAVHHDVSPPLRDIKPSTTVGIAHPALRVPAKPQIVVHAKDTSGGKPPRPHIPSPIANFDGITANGSAPPDTSAAAGLTQVAEIANTKFAVYSKTGSVLYGPVNTNTVWSGFGGGCQTNNDGDGQVQWDTLAQRWVLDQFSVTTTPFLMCLAISTTSDATGTYNRYSFSYTNFPDYPKIGIWPDAYYATINMFNAAGTQALGTMVCAYDRAKMLTGAAATQQCKSPFTSGEHTLAPATLEGTTAPPSGAPNYEVGLGEGANSLQYWKFHVDWTTPANSTLTGPTVLSVSAFSRACNGGTCIPQSGTTQQLDSLGDRVMTSMNYRNYGDHEALVVSHSITAGSSVGKRWYELRVGPGSTLSVFQQGTYAPDSSYRWMGSIGQDKSGDFALGYSVSSSSLHPGIRYTGRLPGDPSGQMPQGEATVITGAGSQTGGLSRWGDYSAMTIDPADDCTFWYASEYIPANGSFNWRTRLSSFKFTQCGGTQTNDFSISANPSSLTVTQGSSGTSTISTTLISGVAESISLSATGLPSGATASFNPNPINTGSSSTLTIATAANTPTGTYTVTVTGTAPSATHSTSISLTVNPVATNDFSISASPSSLTLVQGSSGTSTISTTIISGQSQSVALSISGLPSGATGTFNPNPINSGSSSTLTITTAANTPTGTSTVTVTGTGTSATHSTNISLTVTAPTGGNLLANPGFENGSLPPWVATAGVLNNSLSEPPHSGSWDAWLDGYGRSHTDTLYQQVAIPSNVTTATLSFWLHIDTAETTNSIAYDTLKVQIRNSSNVVLATLATYSNLNKAAGYSLKTFDVSTYKGQTVRVYLLGVEDVSLQTSFVADDFTLSTG